jgi:co-chaperonin GroES (HSP10)
MPLSLLRDRIQVLPDPVRDDVSSAGILIAASKGIVDSRVQFGRRGTVIAVGADIDLEQLKPGDVVLWGEFTFPEYREDGVTYAILQDKDLTAVLEPDEMSMDERIRAAFASPAMAMACACA